MVLQFCYALNSPLSENTNWPQKSPVILLPRAQDSVAMHESSFVVYKNQATSRLEKIAGGSLHHLPIPL